MRSWTNREIFRMTDCAAITVAFVIVSLILLGFPGLQSRCTSTPKIRCANNIRQMGLGIEQYHNVYGNYPPGTVSNPGLPLNRRLGWGATILPYIDYADYLPEHGHTQQAGEALAWDDPAFAELASHPPGITKCPEALDGSTFIGIAGLGRNAPSLPKKHRDAGIFGDDRRVTKADVKDGLANTMMVVESSRVSDPWFAGGRASVRGVDPAQHPQIGEGRPFGGLHRGGANVLMADGSIKFLSESIDPKVFEAMSTMAGGEPVPAWED